MGDAYVGGESLDTTAPQVTNPLPAPSAVDVILGSNISFCVVDDVGGTGVDQSTIQVTVDGNNAIVNGVFQTGYDGAGSAILPISDGFDVTIDPTSDLPQIAVIIIDVDADDLAGPPSNHVDFSWSFTTEAGDITAPTVINRVPDTGAIEVAQAANISFDVIDDSADPNATGVDLSTLDVTIGGVAAMIGNIDQPGFNSITTPITDGYSIAINPDAEFGILEVVEVNVQVDDNIGNSADETWTFTTIEGIVASPVLTAAAGDGVVELSWTVDPLVAVNTWQLRRSLDSTPLLPTDGDLVFEDTSLQAYSDDDVSNGATYFYTVFLIRKFLLGLPVYVPYDVLASASARPILVVAERTAATEYTPQRGELSPIVNPLPGASVFSDRGRELTFLINPGSVVRSPFSGAVRVQNVERGVEISVQRGDITFRMSPVSPLAGGAVAAGVPIGRAVSSSVVMTIDKTPGRFIRPIFAVLTVEKRDG